MSWWGWGANVVLFSGLWFVGNRLWWAFLLTIVGEVVWVVIAINREQYDLAAICALFSGVALRNLVRWRRSRSAGVSDVIAILMRYGHTRESAMNFLLCAGVTDVTGVTPLAQIEAGTGYLVTEWIRTNWGSPNAIAG